MRGELHVSLIGMVLMRRALSALRHGVSQWRHRLGAPIANELITSLNAAVQNGVTLRFVFAVGDPGHELLVRDGGEVLHRLLAQGCVSIHGVPGGDHTFTGQATREQLSATLSQLLLSDFPGTEKSKSASVPGSNRSQFFDEHDDSEAVAPGGTGLDGVAGGVVHGQRAGPDADAHPSEPRSIGARGL